VIDLHLHTTASDGACSPQELVGFLQAAGVHTFAVTDHDTMAAVPETTRLAVDVGLRVVAGIEITAVWEERDVHVLGYFVPAGAPHLDDFLRAQRADRLRRLHAMVARLGELGTPVDERPIVERAQQTSGRSIGRPDLACALVDAGHVTSVDEAFERFLGFGCPAYVSRRGATPAEVVRLLCDIGAASSLAHPGLTKVDDIIPDLARAGLTALEAYHGDHDADTRDRYLRVAAEHGLAVTGGSDYHGGSSHRHGVLGVAGVPAAEFERFCERAGRRVCR